MQGLGPCLEPETNKASVFRKGQFWVHQRDLYMVCVLGDNEELM